MAMFENLSKRLEGIFNNLSGHGKLTEEDVNTALREVRLALIEADVNLKVARQFADRVKEKAIGADVMGSLSPAQQVLSIVNEELVEVLGGTDEKNKLDLGSTPPNVIISSACKVPVKQLRQASWRIICVNRANDLC